MRSRPSCLGLALDAATSRATTRPGTCSRGLPSTAAAARRSSMRALVQEPMKMRSIAMSVSLHAGREPHVVERVAQISRARRRRARARDPEHWRRSAARPRARAPGDDRARYRRHRAPLRGRRRALRPSAARDQAATARSNRAPCGRIGPALRDSRRSSHRARPCRTARRPRSTCCTASAVLPSTARGSRSRQIRSHGRSRRRRRCAR